MHTNIKICFSFVLLTACGAKAPSTNDDGGTVVQHPDIASMATPHYATCRDIAGNVPSASEGSYTLYLNGDETKPWTAWCAGIGPSEYLTLLQSNFSQYTANGTGTDVRTTFSRVRIDPLTLQINVTDRTFAVSTGRLSPCGSPGTFIASMPYGTAEDCQDKTGIGRVDLRGLPFAVVPDAFELGGSGASGDALYSENDQVVDLIAGGRPGWIAAKGGTVKLIYYKQ